MTISHSHAAVETWLYDVDNRFMLSAEEPCCIKESSCLAKTESRVTVKLLNLSMHAQGLRCSSVQCPPTKCLSGHYPPVNNVPLGQN